MARIGRPCELDLLVGRIVCAQDQGLEFMQTSASQKENFESDHPYTSTALANPTYSNIDWAELKS